MIWEYKIILLYCSVIKIIIMKNTITKKQLHKQQLSAIRKLQIEDGMFDGRMRTRSEEGKNKYNRKAKHKNFTY